MLWQSTDSISVSATMFAPLVLVLMLAMPRLGDDATESRRHRRTEVKRRRVIGNT
jgi:hypothetical protein